MSRWLRPMTIAAPRPLAGEPLLRPLRLSDVPPWEAALGVPPRSAAWRLDPGADFMRAWLRRFCALPERERVWYVNHHRAPAMWRRFLDELLPLRAAPGGAQRRYLHPGAVMLPLLTGHEPDPIGELLDALAGPGDAVAGWLSRWAQRGDPLAVAWMVNARPWSMRDLLRRAGHPAHRDAETCTRKADEGLITPSAAVRGIRLLAPEPPALRLDR